MTIPGKWLSDAGPIVALLILSLAAVISCGVKEGREAVLEDRANHSAEVVSWAARDDGRLVASVRIEGPVRAGLEVLTVEIRGTNPAGETVLSEWVTFDLSGMVMGTLPDKTLVLEVSGEMPDGLAVHLHPDPSPEILPRLEELKGVS